VEIPLTEYAGAMSKGKFLDVNRALLGMLGYETKEELLAGKSCIRIVLDLGPGRLGRRSHESMRIEPVEIEWKTEKRHDSESQAQRPRRL